MSPRLATAVVFAASAAILVVEIAAGRLMAPYVGVSLESFTAIIGVVLAGIAVGAAVGGRLADSRDPWLLLGPALVLGGVLVWVSVPLVRVVGPSMSDSPLSIVVLATIGFFAPAVVLSAVTPIVAKLRLRDLGETGSVVGGLSAAGTIGGLAGTFLTGFVLVATVGTRTILYGVGGLLVLGGMSFTWWRFQTRNLSLLLMLPAAWPLVFALDPSCEIETRYSCAVVDEATRDPSRRSLYLDRSHHARVDVDDPTHLDFRYIRLFADVSNSLPDDPLTTLHIGGGGFTLPRYLDAVRPDSVNHVLEIDRGVTEIARDQLGLELSDRLTVEDTDARTALPDLPADSFDLVVGDAFSGKSVPWHLTTLEVARLVERALRPGGVYTLNVIDGGGNRFARAEIATLQEVFDHVGVILARGRAPRSPRNQVIVASDRPLPALGIAEDDGELVVGDALDAYVDGARILTDDFAPVDQLVDN